jgi:alpha-galactosidase
MKESVVHLQGNTSDLIIQTHPVVEILYWGEKISGVEVSAFNGNKNGLIYRNPVSPNAIRPLTDARNHDYHNHYQ